MNHREARRLLSPLLDGEVPPRKEAALRAHLERCPACRRIRRQLEAAEGLLRGLPASFIPLDAGPGGEARLRGLARWGRPARREPAWRPTAVGALAAAAALLVLVWWGPPPAAPPEAPPQPSRVVLAAQMPSSFLAPSLEAPASLPYTLRR